MDDPVAAVAEAALDRALDFGRRWGRGHLLLAAHAAFPPLLTPDLLYAIWRAFAEPTTPWTAVSDVLLSGLCREVSVELYALDPPVREALLDYLAHDRAAGPDRLTALAGFLRAYARDQHHAADPDVRALAEAQDWTGLVYLDPHEAARTLATAFATRDPADTARLARLTELVELLRVPLAAVAPDLLPYARGLTAATLGDWPAAATAFAMLTPANGQITVAGVVLAVPQAVVAPLLDSPQVKMIPKVTKRGATSASWTARQQAELQSGLYGAFRRYADLVKVAEALGQNLSEITGTNDRRQAIAELVSWAARKGRLTELLKAAEKADTSENPNLVTLSIEVAVLSGEKQPSSKDHLKLNLSHTEMGELHGALLSAFRSYSDLERLVFFRLGVNLSSVVPESDLRDMIFSLIGWAEAQGRSQDLIRAAAAENPDNPALQAFIRQVAPELLPQAINTATAALASEPNAPTTVLLAYTPADAKAVDRLAWMLQARGLQVQRIVHQYPDLPIDEDQIVGAIQHGGNALLIYLSQAALADEMLWRVVAQAANERRVTDPTFPIIPVLQDIGPAALGENDQLRALRQLVGTSAQELVQMQTSDDRNLRLLVTQALAWKVLALGLAHRLARDPEPTSSLYLGLGTYERRSYSPTLHLYLDWFPAFSTEAGLPRFPPKDRWAEDLLPALSDVAKVITRQTHIQNIEIWLRAQLPAAIAAGYTFAPKAIGNRRVLWHQPGLEPNTDTIWTYSDQAVSLTEAHQLILTASPADRFNSDSSVILELPITRDEVTADVQKWLTHTSSMPSWHIRGVPQQGTGRASIQSGAQAATWVRQIGEQVRALWGTGTAGAVHLFVASPVAFAALLGQELYDREAGGHPIHLYAEVTDRTQGYQRVCTLGGHDNHSY